MARAKSTARRVLWDEVLVERTGSALERLGDRVIRVPRLDAHKNRPDGQRECYPRGRSRANDAIFVRRIASNAGKAYKVMADLRSAGRRKPTAGATPVIVRGRATYRQVLAVVAAWWDRLEELDTAGLRKVEFQVVSDEEGRTRLHLSWTTDGTRSSFPTFGDSRTDGVGAVGFEMSSGDNSYEHWAGVADTCLGLALARQTESAQDCDTIESAVKLASLAHR